jgi:hypothetical protein
MMYVSSEPPSGHTKETVPRARTVWTVSEGGAAVRAPASLLLGAAL